MKLAAQGDVVVALESSGTYEDALRQACTDGGGERGLRQAYQGAMITPEPTGHCGWNGSLGRMQLLCVRIVTLNRFVR